MSTVTKCSQVNCLNEGFAALVSNVASRVRATAITDCGTMRAAFHTLQLKFGSDRIASYAMHGAGAMVLVNVMRIPCFGRRMTIGRASISWPGAS
jgi:hypothetical protein